MDQVGNRSPITASRVVGGLSRSRTGLLVGTASGSPKGERGAMPKERFAPCSNTGGEPIPYESPMRVGGDRVVRLVLATKQGLNLCPSSYQLDAQPTELFACEPVMQVTSEPPRGVEPRSLLVGTQNGSPGGARTDAGRYLPWMRSGTPCPLGGSRLDVESAGNYRNRTGLACESCGRLPLKGARCNA